MTSELLKGISNTGLNSGQELVFSRSKEIKDSYSGEVPYTNFICSALAAIGVESNSVLNSSKKLVESFVRGQIVRGLSPYFGNDNTIKGTIFDGYLIAGGLNPTQAIDFLSKYGWENLRSIHQFSHLSPDQVLNVLERKPTAKSNDVLPVLISTNTQLVSSLATMRAWSENPQRVCYRQSSNFRAKTIILASSMARRYSAQIEGSGVSHSYSFNDNRSDYPENHRIEDPDLFLMNLHQRDPKAQNQMRQGFRFMQACSITGIPFIRESLRHLHSIYQ